MSNYIPRSAVIREWKKQMMRKARTVAVTQPLELPTSNVLQVPK